MPKGGASNLLLQSWEIDPFVFRIGGDSRTNCHSSLPSSYSSASLNPTSILVAVCEERGWKEYGPDEERYFHGHSLGWNLWWKTSFISSQAPSSASASPKSLYSWQFVNNIPKAIGLCNKEYLGRFMTLMNSTNAHNGGVFDFAPITFILPEDFWKLESEHLRKVHLKKKLEDSISNQQASSSGNHVISAYNGNNNNTSISGNRRCIDDAIWIWKPIGKSQGKGITVINNISCIAEYAEQLKGSSLSLGSSSSSSVQQASVVQEYISRPLLIAGHKFDLRLYVFVPSIAPLTIYVYNEGLVRFAMEKYNIKDLSSPYCHLTNTTLNKTSPDYIKDKKIIGKGCKWTLSKLREYLRNQTEEERLNGTSGTSAGTSETELGDDWYLWQRIISIITLTLIGEASKTGYKFNTKNSFEFLGYDILIDEDMRPWLLEINHSPGLNADCDVDYIVKKPLLHDLFNLLGLPNHGSKTKDVNDWSISDYLSFSTSPLKHIRPSSSPGNPQLQQLRTMRRKSREEVILGKICDRLRKASNEPTNQETQRKSALRKRLIELTAIYSQNLTTSIVNKSSKKNESFQSSNRIKFNKRSQSNHQTQNTDQNQASSDKAFRSRDWIEAPPNRCGGWIRVFPFDEISGSLRFLTVPTGSPMSHQNKPFSLSNEVKTLIQHVDSYLKNVEALVVEKRGLSDREYTRISQSKFNLTVEPWIPPMNE